MGKAIFMRKGAVHTVPSTERLVTFDVVDHGNALATMLGTVGKLTANDIEITASPLAIAFKISEVTVRYVLNRSITVARTIVVNGTVLGTVSAAGDSVSGTVHILNDDTVFIVFNK